MIQTLNTGSDMLFNIWCLHLSEHGITGNKAINIAIQKANDGLIPPMGCPFCKSKKKSVINH